MRWPFATQIHSQINVTTVSLLNFAAVWVLENHNDAVDVMSYLHQSLITLLFIEGPLWHHPCQNPLHVGCLTVLGIHRALSFRTPRSSMNVPTVALTVHTLHSAGVDRILDEIDIVATNCHTANVQNGVFRYSTRL